jgi:hypothetical protein
MTQWDADDYVDTYRGFFNELETGHRENSIYILHKAYLFLGYVPKTLNIDEDTLRGKLYAYRIKNGFPLSKIASEIGLDKCTIGRFERGRNAKQESFNRIEEFLENNFAV